MTEREAVARALMDHQLWPGAFDKPSWQGGFVEREQWLSMADAALAAMRKREVTVPDAARVLLNSPEVVKLMNRLVHHQQTHTALGALWEIAEGDVLTAKEPTQ